MMHMSYRPGVATQMRSRLISISVAFGLALAVLAAASVRAAASGQRCLDVKEQQLAAQFRSVEQVLPQDLAALLQRPEELLLVDVRDDGEHVVGTIEGAIHVTPAIQFDALLQKIGSSVAGKTVIVYCSVGYRSSQLANRFQAALLERGALRVANLRGGVFSWHNHGRPLVDKFGRTDHVHPYSRKWKSYLDFDHLARTSARKNGAD
jgi:rhodanese-related sulfurtransferase